MISFFCVGEKSGCAVVIVSLPSHFTFAFAPKPGTKKRSG
jgi:hypothetical protein